MHINKKSIATWNCFEEPCIHAGSIAKIYSYNVLQGRMQDFCNGVSISKKLAADRLMLLENLKICS